MGDNLDKLIERLQVYSFENSIHSMDTNDMRNAIKALALIPEALVAEIKILIAITDGMAGEIKILKNAKYANICRKIIRWTCSDGSITELDTGATNLIYSQILLNSQTSGEFMIGEFGKGTWETICAI